jgi:hypothetical protein
MHEQPMHERDQDRFIGGWRLVMLEEPAAEGTVRPVGRCHGTVRLHA